MELVNKSALKLLPALLSLDDDDDDDDDDGGN
jgi:hypothetical protein